jgi:hypothetical protein
MKRILFLLLVSVIIITACQKKPYNYYPPEPQIYYKGIKPDTVNFGDTAAYIRIILEFNDGDGDLGTDPQELLNRIYIKDSRDTTAGDSTFTYPFPYVSPNMRPDNGSLQGSIYINLGREYFARILPDSFHLAMGKDTLTYNVYIKDDKEHKSNVIKTDPIYLSF